MTGRNLQKTIAILSLSPFILSSKWLNLSNLIQRETGSLLSCFLFKNSLFDFSLKEVFLLQLSGILEDFLGFSLQLSKYCSKVTGLEQKLYTYFFLNFNVGTKQLVFKNVFLTFCYIITLISCFKDHYCVMGNF